MSNMILLIVAVIALLTISSTTAVDVVEHDNNNKPSSLRGQSQRKLQHTNHFKESACNSDISTATCTPIQTFLNTTQTLPTDDEVKIPCGVCVTMDITDNSILHFPHGLNIVGKLHIPQDSSFELYTKYLLVQGHLVMDSPSQGQTTIPRADGAKVKVILEGNENVNFIPDEDGDNSMMGQTSIGIKPFAVAGGKLDINAIDDDCPSWTILKSLSENKMEITLKDPSAAECWTTGAELLFTPDTLHPLQTQVATIATSNATSGIITLTSPLYTRSTSIEDDFGEHFAVEVALLTRRVTFKPKENTNLIGGHTIILHTPNVVQNIKGVEFRRFGQQGTLGRYPLHFHMSENNPGSRVTKNLVRESNQRCYVIHGTHDVTLADNVAYQTFGHCFMIEDGGEHRNTFLRNLASKTMRPAKKIRAGESDDQPTSFWMTNPVNHYIGNVAAGSEGMGFWLEPMLRGPSKSLAINVGFNPGSAPMGRFDYNKAHSNHAQGIAFYPHGYIPWNHGGQIMNGLVATKNSGTGIRIGASNQLHFHGAFVSDNHGAGFENSGGANHVVRDSIIERISDHQRSLIAKGRGGGNPCGSGITFPADKDHKGMGTELYNVTFRNYDAWITGNPNPTGSCSGTAISATTVSMRHKLYAMKMKFSDLSFEGEGSSFPNHRLSVCGAASGGTTGYAFDDLDGSLSPTGAPGTFLQQSDHALMAFKPDGCIPTGGCLMFCPNSCYRHIKLDIPGADVGKTAVVTRSDGVSTTLPRKQFMNWNAHYGTALAGGYTYQITFIEDGSNIETWPLSVTPRFYPSAGCSPSLSTTDVELVPPSPSSRPSFSPTITAQPTTSPKPTISIEPTFFPTQSSAPTNPIDACYLATSCPAGFLDKGIAGVIGRSDSIGFLKGGSFGGGWTWYHPRLCCGGSVPTDTSTKAMCAKHDDNGEQVMGHWMTAESPDPYLAGGGKSGSWDWRHPRTCTASSSQSVCLFSETEKCRPGMVNWGKSRLIMEGSSDLLFYAGSYNGGSWNYHEPWLCCTEGIEQTDSPTTNPTLSPSSSQPPSGDIPQPDVCYLARSCPDGYVSEGWAGVLGRDSSPFNRGGGFGWGWYWYHPQICCGPPDSSPLASTMYAMCPSGDSQLGHNHKQEYGDPYGNGGGNDGPGWKWSHPFTCSPSDANACVFTKEPVGPKGYTNKGQSRIIMNASGTLTPTYGQRFNGWWYHKPWLFCKDDETIA